MTTTNSMMTTTGSPKTRKPRKPRKTAASKKLPSNPFMNEILELAVQQKTDAKKVAILQEYECDALKSLFIWNFDDSIISLLPEGNVPYKPN